MSDNEKKDERPLEPFRVGPFGKDRCTICWTATKYYPSDPVDVRECYTAAGQLCPACYKRTRPTQ